MKGGIFHSDVADAPKTSNIVGMNKDGSNAILNNVIEELLEINPLPDRAVPLFLQFLYITERLGYRKMVNGHLMTRLSNKLLAQFDRVQHPQKEYLSRTLLMSKSLGGRQVPGDVAAGAAKLLKLAKGGKTE